MSSSSSSSSTTIHHRPRRQSHKQQCYHRNNTNNNHHNVHIDSSSLSAASSSSSSTSSPSSDEETTTTTTVISSISAKAPLLPLHFFSTSSSSSSSPYDHEKSPAISSSLLTDHHHYHNTSKTRGKKRLQQQQCKLRRFFSRYVLLLLLRILIVCILVDRGYYNVKYLLMGRPAWIYGTPSDWETVKGCLLLRNDDQHSSESTSINNNNNTTTTIKPIIASEEKDNYDGGDDDANDNNVRNILTGTRLSQLPLNPNARWEWSRYSSPSSSSSSPTTIMTPHRRLLIAQYTGFGKYKQMLDEVEPINKAYAQKWGHDYVSLHGTAIHFPDFTYDDDDQRRRDSKATSSNNNNDNGSSSSNENDYDASMINTTTTTKFVSQKRETGGGDDDSNNHDHHHQAFCQTNNYEAQSTFNKIPLLLHALEEEEELEKNNDDNSKHPTAEDTTMTTKQQLRLRYDQILILDTDTMIVDFDFDITSLLVRDDARKYDLSTTTTASSSVDDNTVPLPPKSDVKTSSNMTPEQRNHDQFSSRTIDENDDYMLAAYRVWWHDWTSTWDINAGITLWNLHHPLTRQVADTWWRSALDHPKDVLLKNDDQFFLQRALLGLGFWNRWDTIRTVREEMEYYEGTVIKHFKRDARSWSTTGLDQRMERIREVKTDICNKWPTDCQRIIGGSATDGEK